MEASSFVNAFGLFGRDELGRGDGINIHGVRMRGGSRGG